MRSRIRKLWIRFQCWRGKHTWESFRVEDVDAWFYGLRDYKGTTRSRCRHCGHWSEYVTSSFEGTFCV